MPVSPSTMPTLLRRLLADDSGQDMIEYALLTVFFGLAAVAALGITDGLGANYTGLTTSTNALWQTPNPLPPAGP